MEKDLKEGIKFASEMVVTENHTAITLGSGDLQVYATPAMIAFMENTAKKCVEMHLDSEDTTVGIEVNVKHIKATPVGMKVNCQVELIKIEGKRLFFTANIWDEKGKIGEGKHTRYIVNSKEFLNRIK